MNKSEFELVKGYLNEQGMGIINTGHQARRRNSIRQAVSELIENNDHPLIKVDIVDVDVDSDAEHNIPNTFIVAHNDTVNIIRKAGDGEFLVVGGGDVPPFITSDCFAVKVSFRYAEPTRIAKVLIKRTPPASLLLLLLVAFIMASPIYSNLFNSRLVFGESVSSLIVVSVVFILIFILEYFIKELIMANLNRRIEVESRIAEDIMFNKIINSKHKDAIIHWKTATESVSVIWKSIGHIGLDFLTIFVIMSAFIFMLGAYSIFPVTIYLLFFFVQLFMKMKTYRKILLINQLKDQKLTYLIGMEKGKEYFKFLNRDRLRRRWMSMTDDISVFNIQIQDHEEKSGGVLKLYSSTSIVIIFIAAYFAIQAGDLQQSAVIALMLLNGRCSGAISSLSNRIYQSVIANSKMKGAITALHEDHDFAMFEKGVVFSSQNNNTITVKNLSVVYGETPAFSGVNFSISKGMSLAIIGTAGIGKSSLLKTLAGHTPASKGQVLLNNVAPFEFDSSFFKDSVAFYSPEDRFIADTLGFNVGLKFGSNMSAFFDLLKGFGVNFALNQHIIHGDVVDNLKLSSGQYQLLKMISSLGCNPELIIMDEPCSHLSPIEGSRFMQLLRSRFPDAIIIYSSHSVMLAKQANLIFDMNKNIISTNK